MVLGVFDMRMLRSGAAFVCAMLCAGTSVATAQDATSRPSLFSFGPTASTLGLGAEASFLLHDNVVLRGGGSVYKLDSVDISGSSASANFGVNGTFAGLLIDWHPFRSGWRLSTGVRYANVSFKGNDLGDVSTQTTVCSPTCTTTTTSVSKIGSTSFNSADVGVVHREITNRNAAAPYLGFGYDLAHFGNSGSGFTVGMDIGALFIGDVNVKVTTDKSTAGVAAAIKEEEASIRDGAAKYYRFYPVFQISGKIHF